METSGFLGPLNKLRFVIPTLYEAKGVGVKIQGQCGAEKEFLVSQDVVSNKKLREVCTGS